MGPGVVGREGELEEVDRFLDDAGRSFTALVLEGQPGIGKTTVWREATNRAQQRGWLTLSCRPAEAEAKLSFAAITDLLEPIGATALASLAAPQREALEVALLRTGPTEAGSISRAVAAGFLALIRRLAATRPLVIAVDDWQWLDLPSRRVIEFAARRLESEPLGLLCSVRSPAAVPAFDQTVGAARVRRVVVGPLSLAALGRIVGARVKQPLPRPLLVRIAQASGGNPFYALEIARLLGERGHEPLAGAALPVPDDLRTLAVSRIRRLPVNARDAVLLAAVLANPTSEILRLDALGPAEEAGIVAVTGTGRVEFTHPLFASAAYESVAANRQRELHIHAAQLVSDPEQRARHLALGHGRRDAAVAAQLDEAAALAASRGAPAAAAELAELAIERTPSADAAPRHRRLAIAARFQLEAGDLARAEHLTNAAIAESTSSSVRAAALQVAAQLSVRRSDASHAAELAASALEAADDDRTRAAIELDLVYCTSSLGDLAGAESHAEAAAAYAEAAGEHGILGDALAVLTMASFLFGRGRNMDRLREALRLEDPLMSRWWIMRPSVIHGLIQLWLGELDGALATLDAVHVQSIERGMESFTPTTSFYRVWASVWRGDFARAASWSEEARAAAEVLEDPWGLGMALAAEALVAGHTGQTDLARTSARESLALLERVQFRTGVIWPLWALGVAELSVENPAGADATLRGLVDQVGAMGAADPVLMMFLPDEVEALIALGELDRAAAYLEPFLRRAREFDRAWAMAAAERCRCGLDGALGDIDSAALAFDRALAAHERVAMPFERARTLLVAGQVFRRFKQRARARELLEEALSVFELLGAPLWAGRARGELARVGGPGTSPGGLTDTEERIARLVSEGLSNQEVALRAFVSVKTVESNLTRIYRKLGVDSRVALANSLRSADAADQESTT